ncbi:type I polyketide synthase [Paraburkholderia dinghuensis]|uniref:SDR family NAD(P)-dependent oxidoreductase n=1 Tax=Paraburkholderia dinghuensis TaxID=2305225 RepID=A0A3N6MY21_9BURK|nr:type I polyketide synthase [Paraburkholderia dinghuensis]RQH08898.1 SDR family NAD(P)-dependent oxidoreductase [Paraburkholderia dinghuensis]
MKNSKAKIILKFEFTFIAFYLDSWLLLFFSSSFSDDVLNIWNSMNDIAVVGMACRLPGGLDNPDLLLTALRQRILTVGPIPSDRWDAARYYSTNENAKGKAYVNQGNFLKQDIRSMDAEFFDLPARVAENLDPQQRLLMELIWEAFENAHLSLPAHAGRNVGVYVGGFMLDHMFTLMQQSNRAYSNASTAAAMMMTMLAARLSHMFDLRGPSLSMDTACSSSLVAFSYACHDIWAGVCDMAVVGGASVMSRPEYAIGMCKGQFLSRDGQCKSFDERGDGYGRAEGGGIVLLKTLERALADGDTILATVAGAGVNSDGRTPGISMPSADAQIRLIRDVCERFRIDPAQVRYVECHGTGTAVGDPIEATSIGTVYGAGRHDDARVVLGSIKSNVGHMEAGAGVASVIKAILTLQHREAFPLGNLQTPHPGIPFEELGVRLADRSIRLAEVDEPFMVAVNSFGYGGTNAHVVLRSAPPATATGKARTATVPAVAAGKRPAGFPLYLPLSTRSSAALQALAQRYLDRMSQPDADFTDVLHSAALYRAPLSHRAVVLGDDADQLREGLKTLAHGEKSSRTITGHQVSQEQTLPVWVFTGMGPQWWAMGQELYRDEPSYRMAVDEADPIFQRIAGFSIVAEMLKDESSSQITQTVNAQCANLIIQLGIVAVLRAAGVVPGAVVGHSVGEVAAACISGALSLEDALRVIYERSRLQARTAGTGSMLAAGLEPESASSWIEPFAGRIEIAAVNGPNTITLSGETAAIDALAANLATHDIFHRTLTVEVPYHSYLMEPILDELEMSLDAIVAREPKIPLYSTVTGRRVEGSAFGADYWPQNVRQPVNFMGAIEALLDDGFATFVQIGPHPVLSSALRDCAKARAKEIHTVETLRRNEHECARIHRAVADVFAGGCDIDWMPLNGQGTPAALPNYPWQRERFWLETELSAHTRIHSTALPMLGIENYPAVNTWVNDVEHEALAWLKEHVVSGTPVMPAAGYLETLLEIAGLRHADAPGWRVSDVTIHAPMVIPLDRATSYVSSYDYRSGHAEIRSIESGRIGQGTLHLDGNIAPLPVAEAGDIDLGALKASLGVHRDPQDFYRALSGIGLQYGPEFQLVRTLQISRDETRVLALIECLPELYSKGYRAYPAALDACFQSLVGMFGSTDRTFLPTGLRELRMLVPALPARFWCHAIKTRATGRQVEADLTLIDDSGAVLMVIRGMCLTAMSAKRESVDSFGEPVKLQMVRHEWAPAGYLTTATRVGGWLVVEDGQGDAANLADQIATGIRKHATVCTHLRKGEALDLQGMCLTVRPNADDVKAALEAAGPLNGVVFVHGAAARLAGTDPAGIQALQFMLMVTQCLAALPIEQRPRAYVLTRGAFRISDVDNPVQPAQTALNGFARVAFNEIDGLQFSAVDIPDDATDQDIESAVLELVCDAPEDEVAIRRGRRLFSRLTARPWLTQPLVKSVPLRDRVVKARRLADQDDAAGSVSLIEIPRAPLDDGDIELKIVSMVLTDQVLRTSDTEATGSGYVEVVATVARTGVQVDDLHVGQRVYGLAPADFSSHICGPRNAFHLVAIDDDTQSESLLCRGVREAAAECLVEQADLDHDACVLVQADAFGLAIDAALRRRGIGTVLLACHDTQPTQDHACVSPMLRGATTLAGIERAVDEYTGGRGFTAFAGPMAEWGQHFGWRALATGGVLIDTAEAPHSFVVPTAASAIVRADLSVLTQRAGRFITALKNVIARIGEQPCGSDTLRPVSITELVTKKLELPAAGDAVVVDFDADLASLPVQVHEEVCFRADATYLVTGGFGGFGQKTAIWLVEHGARHLVLVGRTGASTPERTAFVDELRQRGAEVTCVTCDLSDESEVRDLFATLRDTAFPLRGIFHSAAVIIDNPIFDIDVQEQTEVMRSKAESARLLHEYSRGLPIDYFVLYSSIAAEIGSSRQSSYVSANGFLDGLAWHRRSLGLPATSINWGAIADVGVVTLDDKLAQFMRYTGLRGMQSADALNWLERALARDVTQLGITLISTWSEWGSYETLGARSPRVAELVASDAVSDDSAGELLRAELAGLPASKRLIVLASRVSALVAGLLDMPADHISIDRPIMDFGIDSLMATEIQLLLREDLNIMVSVLEIGDGMTIRMITNEALNNWGLGNSDASVVSQPVVLQREAAHEHAALAT